MTSVTVTEVGREAGVSSVTVFKHFPRKEDLLLDRADDAVEVLRTAVRADGDVLASLRAATLRLADERHALSGLKDASVPFFATVAASPALIARAREIADDLQRTLTEELAVPDAGLLAAFYVSGYATVLVETARRQLAGESPDDVADDHRARVEVIFDRLRTGFSG
ncbi:TetR/AcrR family transcriptional regulator [Kribbella karoonensis]|uniref:TetR/AcrR family transcriptional regulator n=1 Tax=Kribbella karoonensis TaxID=324851 RepID=UPI0031DC987E